MPSAAEALAAGSQLKAILDASVDTVSGGQQVTFTKYTKKILPADGFVFWVLSSLLGDSTPPVQLAGSLHVSGEKRQDIDHAFSQVAVVFTSKTDASQGFLSLGPDDLLLATATLGTDGAQPVTFAFSRLGFYGNAGMYHYSGVAVFPQHMSQFVSTQAALIGLTSQVLSNSMPAWLKLSQYTPTLPSYGFGNTVPLYPSLLVTPNSLPPFGSVHVAPESTEAVAPLPFLDATCSHFQLARERVRVAFYGVDNAGICT